MAYEKERDRTYQQEYRKKNPAGKYWMLTLWPDDENRAGGCVSVPWAALPGLVYGLTGFELCPETGGLHAHVYLAFKENKRFSWVVSAFGGASLCHVEKRIGKHEAAVDYIKATGRFVGKEGWLNIIEEYGDDRTLKSGGGGDYVALMEDIFNGVPEVELLRKYPAIMIRSYRNIGAILETVAFNRRNNDREVEDHEND